MKKLAYSKKITNETNTLETSMSKVFSDYKEHINEYCIKLNKEYVQNLNKLIENIALGENLDVKMLKKKYIKGELIDTLLPSESVSISEILLTSNESNEILDKIVINAEEYYYEKKEDGNVYNKSLILVGKYKNNVITFITI